jgi:glutathione synthase/RimK-type ligase-like ATP-grasp enzyme
MKIGIHNNNNSFSDKWINYCKLQNIDYKIIDCYNTNIIHQLDDCDALLWHFNNTSSKDCKFAKQLLYSLQISGKIVFPNFNTAWHFDDKVGQKYLLESLELPLVPSYVFYSKKEAIEWIKTTTFPKVFKLRGGAGSSNVRLAQNKSEAIKLTNRSFGRGFLQYNAWASLKERYRKYKNGKTNAYDVFKGVVRFFYSTEFTKMAGRELGYIYFQDFIPDNGHDIRVIVIDRKAFAIKRMVRKNDFRASGSGMIRYEKENFDLETIRLSFEIADKLKSQCLALDYVYQDNKPLVVEISYGFVAAGYDPCPGYWDSDLNWYEGSFNPQAWMVELVIREINDNQTSMSPSNLTETPKSEIPS